MLPLLSHPFLMPVALLLAGMAALSKAPKPGEPGSPEYIAASKQLPPTMPSVGELLDPERLSTGGVVQKFKPAVASSLMLALGDSSLAEHGSPGPGVLVYRLIQAQPGMPTAAQSAVEARELGMLVLASTSLVDFSKTVEHHYLVLAEPQHRQLASGEGELAILLEAAVEAQPAATAVVSKDPEEIVVHPAAQPTVAGSSETPVDVEAPTEPPPAAPKAKAKKAAPKTKAAKAVGKTAEPKHLNGAASKPAFTAPETALPNPDVTA